MRPYVSRACNVRVGDRIGGALVIAVDFARSGTARRFTFADYSQRTYAAGHELPVEYAPRAPVSDAAGALPRMAQQIDLDGNLHDLAPQSERMRLFESAPQLRGQTHLDTD